MIVKDRTRKKKQENENRIKDKEYRLFNQQR